MVITSKYQISSYPQIILAYVLNTEFEEQNVSGKGKLFHIKLPLYLIQFNDNYSSACLHLCLYSVRRACRSHCLYRIHRLRTSLRRRHHHLSRFLNKQLLWSWIPGQPRRHLPQVSSFLRLLFTLCNSIIRRAAFYSPLIFGSCNIISLSDESFSNIR